MPREVPVEEVACDFTAYVNQVMDSGESIVLTRGGQPVAELRPVSRDVTFGELPALFDSLPRLDTEEAEAFAADIEAARVWLNGIPLLDPWED
ncbi:MAG TPA: hypothetical protein VF746_24470 [Longimicrobium sp.]|jgi:antitoxin (DNA-binding transcriptional repressor) of toxin-antitoxin stability system